MTISEIKSVKDKSDIVQVISHFVKLRKDGHNYSAPCPLHDERSASFNVSSAKRIFKCFGCGKGGDVIDFIQAVKRITKYEAIKWLQEFGNIESEPEYSYTPPPETPTSYVNPQLWAASMRLDKPNHFTAWLMSLFGIDKTMEVVNLYNIGTSRHWEGANIFWQFDTTNRIRSGKIMVYNPKNGKRVKDPKPLITWVHKAARLPEFNVSVCLYGEHLLNTSPLPVCIVESEKTAIVASLIYPESLWIASGSLSNLSYSRCKCLSGRAITLIPDCGAEQRWFEKSDQLRDLIPGEWSVKPLGSGFQKGYDLCDYIIEHEL